MTITQRGRFQNTEEGFGGAIFCMLIILWIVVYVINLP